MTHHVLAQVEFGVETDGRSPTPLKKKPFIQPEAGDGNPVEYDCAFIGVRRAANGEWRSLMELPISGKPWGRIYVTDERVAVYYSPSGKGFKNSAMVGHVRHVNCLGIGAHRFAMGLSHNFGAIWLAVQEKPSGDMIRLELRLTGRGNGPALADDILARVIRKHRAAFTDQWDDESRAKYDDLEHFRFDPPSREWESKVIPTSIPLTA